MSWKNSEPPINLIHILPSEREKSSTKTAFDQSSHLRIQVGDESPSVVMMCIAKFLSLVRRGFQKLGAMIYVGFAWCQNGCKGIVRRFMALIVGLQVFMKKIVETGVRCIIKSSKHVNFSVRKAWKVLTRSRTRPNQRVLSIPETRHVQSIEQPTKLERDELLWEVHALREQLLTQQHELTRVNAQVGELKALALSQQQVLLHLGQELETIETKTVRPEKASIKKPKTRSSKVSKSKSKSTPSPSPPSSEASLSFDPQP